jgi:hypothetical protein
MSWKIEIALENKNMQNIKVNTWNWKKKLN